MDLIVDLLLLVELTELGERVPDHGLELWALDCARRAVGADNRALDPHVKRLRASLRIARSWLRQGRPEPGREAVLEAEGVVRDCAARLANARQQRSGLAIVRACRAADAAIAAFEGVLGQPDHERVARAAREAFPADHHDAEAGAQARRLLLRGKLLPTGAELLVRLDYAEGRGALPRDPEQRAWLDGQRALLMGEDEQGRLAVVLRYLDRLYLAELDRA